MRHIEYILNPQNEIKVNGDLVLSNNSICKAVEFCNNAIMTIDKQTKEFDINIFELLGMRNLSGFVGECFAKSVERFSLDNLHSNLHQDGYPDLCLTNTQERMAYYKSLYKSQGGRKYPKDKASFSPFKYGGIEIKATCGSTPNATKIAKPLIGEQRISIVNSLDWKAHHRETNNLLSIFWDFIDEVPTIVACFYRNDLTENDWSKIVQPKVGGGRTTSVSIMTSAGVKKMCLGWIVMINSEMYIKAFANKKWIGYRVS